MKRLDDETFDLIAARVVEECGRRGVSGVFAMSDLESLYSSTTIRWQRCMRSDLLRQGVPDKPDANYLAIALAKLAMVMVHGKNTGFPTTRVGEVPFMGGRLSEDGLFAYAFSGAPQEVDDEITQDAEAFHKSLK